MKPVKGLYLDIRPQEQPEGTYPYAKNGIQHDLLGSSFNEEGFRKLATVVPYQLMGVIETDDKPVVFSTNNTNSAVGYFNPRTELYEPIIDDSNWSLVPAKLGFSVNYYITGQSQRNYKGELVVAFTDKRPWPKYLNCDNPSLASLDDLRLFPFFKPPVITAVPTIGGRVSAGTYYVAIAYERNDGTSTAYSPVSKFVTIPPLNGVQGLTDKAIEITITDADTSFDSMRIAIISKIEGKTTAVELTDYIPVNSGSITFLYTGDNLTTDITIESVLVQPAFYNKVGTIGQLNDALYIGELESEPNLNDMQPWANMVQVECVSQLIDAVNPPDEHINGTKKGHMHEEVVALYIRYRKTRGGTTKWFHIPGNAPLVGDESPSSESAAGGGGSVPKFKVEDTIPHYDPVALTCATGIWINQTEIYPDTVDFDSSALGGTNLRKKAVRHHKMPSLRWCKEKFYNADVRYGKSHLDMLGLRAVNVRVPDKYKDMINGYEIGYAKRTVGNMTVYGQSVLMHGAIGTSPLPIYTTGGNFNSQIIGRTGDNYGTLELKKDTFRFHSFDLLFNKPSIDPTFISSQLRLRKNDIQYLEDGEANEAEGGGKRPLIHLIDYVEGTTPVKALPGRYLRKINKSFYLTVDVNANDFVNIHQENTFAGTLAGSNWDMNQGTSTFKIFNQYTEYDWGSPKFEETYLVNLIVVKSDLYSSMFSQQLVSAGTMKALTDSTPFFGGDTFISDFTFHTYGRHNANDDGGEGYLGTKVIRRFVCESISNINLRYETLGNEYSKWWPHNGVVSNSPTQTYISTFDRSKDPNQFGYSKDFNALNDLVQSTIYSPYREELTVFPYRIHRGGKLSRQSKPRSWRTFLPLDYYEMQKNMGRIIHLEGMEDRLLIHMENGLFLTQDKATLDGGELNVTLGSGDIFQFEPQPAEDSKLGVGGTQHDLACVNTPIGYIFPDAKQGELYLFKGKLQNMGIGINTFLREYLKVKDVNIFQGNGITIGWDQKYKRVLLTVKRKEIPTVVIKDYFDTEAFWNSLVVGDIIRYHGRLIEYKGVNNSTVSGYSCTADRVPDVITWQQAAPYCAQRNGHNTGMVWFANRIRLVNGITDGYSEPNSPNSGVGTYFPGYYDASTCPLAAPVTTWQGSEAFCEGNAATCPPGYILSADGTLCTKDDIAPPTVTQSSICLVPSQLASQYSGAGTKLYDTGYGTLLTGTFTLLNSNTWIEHNGQVTGPMNRVGVWVDTNCDGVKDGLGVGATLEFSKQITSVAGETIYIGLGGDNTFRVDLNGTTIVDVDFNSIGSAAFNYWHIIPVVIPAGASILSFKADGDGSPADSFGAVIYRNTPAQITAASSDTDLTIDFKTTDLIGNSIDIASCAPGWILDTSGGSGHYLCRKTVTTSPTVSASTSVKAYAKRCRYLDGVPDGYCEDNTAGANYVASVVDLTTCPVPITGLLCGARVSEDFNGTGLHNYVEQVISIASGPVNVKWSSYERPNRFSIYKDGGLLLTTGWRGYALYAGPWGSTLEGLDEDGTMSYVADPGHTYVIRVEAGPADPSNVMSDTYFYQINCG